MLVLQQMAWTNTADSWYIAKGHTTRNELLKFHAQVEELTGEIALFQPSNQ
jgi:hypothetical protein